MMAVLPLALPYCAIPPQTSHVTVPPLMMTVLCVAPLAPSPPQTALIVPPLMMTVLLWALPYFDNPP